jgi:multidrug efflux system outer membrane protein
VSRAPIALALSAALLVGCRSLAGPFQRPTVALPEAYSRGGASDAEVADAWWSLFGDPALDALIEEALRANQDLALAAARVEEARALLGLRRAERLPDVTAQAAGSRSKLSSATSQLPPGFPLEFDRVSATANLSYELDFWGRLRRSARAARADLLASEEGRRNVRLAVAAEVALAYFDLLALERQLEIARETRGSRTEWVRLTNLRVDAGTISELDLAQAQAELASTEAAVPALERAVRQTEDRLAVLLGRIGGTVERAAGLAALTLPEAPAGLPSTLLERRPDILAAEHGLAAAHARVGVARAAYFPTISLTGYAGSESRELADLFKSGTGIWGAALGLVQPLLNINRTRRDVQAASARERQALAIYVKTIQVAFAEVEDSLIARTTGTAEREALGRQVDALSRARHLANLRYEGGDSSYLEVLDSERSLFRAQLELVSARRAELQAAVTLFKALGGGWESENQVSGN